MCVAWVKTQSSTRHLERVSDPGHGVNDQTCPHGRGAVISSPRGELKVKLVGCRNG
jgi:hypothetical protein